MGNSGPILEVVSLLRWSHYRDAPSEMSSVQVLLFLLGCKPTLLECQNLGIVSKMASNWSRLAIYLGLEDRMGRIDDDYSKVREKCSNVLKLWIKGKGRKHSKEPVTWKTLLDTIQKLYPSFADDLRTKFAT